MGRKMISVRLTFLAAIYGGRSCGGKGTLASAFRLHSLPCKPYNRCLSTGHLAETETREGTGTGEEHGVVAIAPASKAKLKEVVFSFTPVEGPLEPLFVDDHILVLNKPSGLLCVPGRDEKDCLVSRAAVFYGHSRIDKMIVHRLDMATSGCVVMARTDEALRDLHTQFRMRKVRKRYRALVYGHVAANEGEVDLPLRKDMDRPPLQMVDVFLGKPSLTHWQVIRRGMYPETATYGEGLLKEQAERLRSALVGNEVNENEHAVSGGDVLATGSSPSLSSTYGKDWLNAEGHSNGTMSQGYIRDVLGRSAAEPSSTSATLPQPVTWLELTPHTGRSHQLRVHMAAIGHPIVGDFLYAHEEALQLSPARCMLHSHSISFVHPDTKEPVFVSAPCPF